MNANTNTRTQQHLQHLHHAIARPQNFNHDPDPDLQPVFTRGPGRHPHPHLTSLPVPVTAPAQRQSLATIAAHASQHLSVAVDLPAAAHVYLWDSTPIGDSQVIDSLHTHGCASVKVANAALTALRTFIERKERKPAHGDLIGFFLSSPSKASPSAKLAPSPAVPTDFACFDAGIVLEQLGERVPTNARGTGAAIPVYWTHVSENALLQTLGSLLPERRSTVFIYNAAMSKLVYCDLLQHFRLHLTPIRPLSLVENSVAAGLLRNQQRSLTSGFITINRARCAYLLRNEPTQLPLVGVWTSGCRPTSRPILDTCLAFTYSDTLSKLAGPPYLLACFPRLDARPGQPEPPPTSTSPQYFTWRVECLGQACMMADFRASPGHWIVSPLKQVDVLGVTRAYEAPPQSLAEHATHVPENPNAPSGARPPSSPPRPRASPPRASPKPSPRPNPPQHQPVPANPVPLPVAPIAAHPSQIGDQSMHALVNQLLKHIDILHAQLLSAQSSPPLPHPLRPECKSVGVNTPAEWLVPAPLAEHVSPVLSHAATATDDDAGLQSMSVASRPPTGNYVPVFPPDSVAGASAPVRHHHSPVVGRVAEDTEAGEYNVSVSEDTLARIARMAQSGNDAVVVSSALGDEHVAGSQVCQEDEEVEEQRVVPAWAADVHGNGKDTVVVHAGYAGEAIEKERAPWEGVEEERDQQEPEQVNQDVALSSERPMLPNPEACSHETTQDPTSTVAHQTSNLDDDLTNSTMNLTSLDDELARKYLGDYQQYVLSSTAELSKVDKSAAEHGEGGLTQDLSPLSSGLVSSGMSSADEGGSNGMDMSVATLEYLRKYGLLR